MPKRLRISAKGWQDHLTAVRFPWKGFPWALAIWSVVGWAFLAAPRESPSPIIAYIWPVGLDILFILYMGFKVIGRHKYSPAQGIAIVVFAVLMILQGFTVTYYDIGTANNFSQALTRLDAAYVALGNLSTAGTGNIYPTSEGARAWVMGQYCADIVLLVGLVSFLLWRAGKNN
jgi:hypothetical protein